MSVIICTSTGTMLSAETCRIVPDDAFTDSEWDGMDDRSDSEIAAFGRERGRPVLSEVEALDIIADLIRSTGRTIADA